MAIYGNPRYQKRISQFVERLRFEHGGNLMAEQLYEDWLQVVKELDTLRAYTRGERWDAVPWTEFQEAEMPHHPLEDFKPRIAMNSHYQVAVYPPMTGEPFGRIVHLSIKTHDRAARHDWRDLQRIKNEVVGPEFDAVEIYPDEHHVVDMANQYHLWVFLDYKLPFGFKDGRMVADGETDDGSFQRPFTLRPEDCMDPEQVKAKIAEQLEKRKERLRAEVQIPDRDGVHGDRDRGVDPRKPTATDEG